MPGGPPPQCSDTGPYGEQVQRSRLHLGIGLGSLSSTLRFDDETDVHIDMNTISVSGSWQINDSWSMRSGIGLIRDGQLKPAGQAAQEVKPGGLLALGFEYLYQRGEAYRPTLDFSAFLSASSAKIENLETGSKTSYFSSDLRLGARASWSIKNSLFPSLSARVFGGPVSWELASSDVTGTDIYHYQIALGTAYQFGSIGTFVEWAGLGEKALSVGMSYAW